jgi:hypothetical protein
MGPSFCEMLQIEGLNEGIYDVTFVAMEGRKGTYGKQTSGLLDSFDNCDRHGRSRLCGEVVS